MELFELAKYRALNGNGGGGGGLTVPHLSMKVTNIGQVPAIWMNFGLPFESMYIEDGYLYLGGHDPSGAIQPNQNVVLDVMYGRIAEENGPVYSVAAPTSATFKNLVNCTIVANPFDTIVITDPTQNASIDVEVEGTR